MRKWERVGGRRRKRRQRNGEWDENERANTKGARVIFCVYSLHTLSHTALHSARSVSLGSLQIHPLRN